MEQVLASGEGAEDVSGRVAALLAGSSLTTSKGVAKGEAREVETVEYEGGKKIISDMSDFPHQPLPATRVGRADPQVVRRTHDLSQALRFSRRRHSWMTGKSCLDTT